VRAAIRPTTVSHHPALSARRRAKRDESVAARAMAQNGSTALLYACPAAAAMSSLRHARLPPIRVATFTST